MSTEKLSHSPMPSDVGMRFARFAFVASCDWLTAAAGASVFVSFVLCAPVAAIGVRFFDL